MAVVSRKDFDRAFQAWSSNVMHLPHDLRRKCWNGTFNDFIGCVPLYSKGTKSHTITEEAARKIAMLLNPNATTLFRVWVIQHCEPS